MSLVALPWFAFQVTGDPALTGIAAAAEFLPVMLASLISGAIVARLDARGTRGVSDLVSGVAVLAPGAVCWRRSTDRPCCTARPRSA